MMVMVDDNDDNDDDNEETARYYLVGPDNDVGMARACGERV